MRQAELAVATPTTPAERIAAWWRDNPEQIAKLAPSVSLAKYSYVATPGIDKTGLNLLLANDQLLGYFEIPDDPVADASGATYVTRKLTNQDVRNWYCGTRHRRSARPAHSRREHCRVRGRLDSNAGAVRFGASRQQRRRIESRARRHAGPVGTGRVRLSAVDIDLLDRADAADEHSRRKIQQTRRGAAVVDRAGRIDGRQDRRNRSHRADDRRFVADTSTRGGAVAAAACSAAAAASICRGSSTTRRISCRSSCISCSAICSTPRCCAASVRSRTT